MGAPDVEKRLHDLDDLLRIARAMSRQQDLRSLMELIVDAASGMLQAERSSLYLVDEEKEQLYTWIAEELEIREVRLPFGKGIAGHVASSKEVLSIPDAYADTRFDRKWDKKTGFRTRNVLCAPLITPEGRLVGVIQVMNTRKGEFSKYGETILTALCSHAAVCLDNARLIQHYIEKERIQQALEIAREIQHKLLPEKAPYVRGYDIAGWTEPCDETGGDYYDFIELDGGKVALVVGDVSSHGVGPALLMTTARAFLRALVQQKLSVSEVVTRLNRLLEQDMDEGRFMTLFHGLLDSAEGVLHYCSAGHEPGLYLNGRSGEFSRVPNTGYPLGIFADGAFPEGEPLKLRKGDIFALLTDGIVEAMNKKREAFGIDRLRTTIARHTHQSAATIIQRVHEAVVKFQGGEPTRDDLTMVVVKVTE